MEGNDHSLNLRPLSDSDIEEQGLSLSDVWMLQTPSGRSKGPFSTEQLRSDSKRRPAYYEECQVFNLVTEVWKAFYVLPEFQRRKPKLIPAQNLVKTESFLVLSSGQKTGPFSTQEVQELIEKKQISLNQEISVDNGSTWIKLYEHHAFDRRARVAQDELPFQPNMEVFHNADERTSAKVLQLQKEKDEGRVISGLAFLGRGNDRGQRITVHKSTAKNTQSKNSQNGTSQSSQESKAATQAAEKDMPQTLDALERHNSAKKFKVKAFASAMLVLFVSVAIMRGFNEDEQLLGQTDIKDQKSIDNSSRALVKRKPASVHNVKPAKTPRARRYKKEASANRRMEAPKVISRSTPKPRRRERVEHKYEDFESIDMNDPKVRDELARELSGEFEDSEPEREAMDSEGMAYEDEPYEDYNDQGEAPPAGENQFGEEQGEEPPYEEYGDFE